MSRPTPIEIVCPYCAAKNRLKVWLNLNARVDGLQIENAQSGKLFEVECKACKNDIPLEHSLHFHDPDGKRYYRFDAPSGGLQANLEELPHGGAEYTLRRAADFSSLLELLHIWKECLEDAPMLLMKHMLAAEVEQQAGNPPMICNFSHVDRSSGEQTLEFVVIETEEGDGQNAGVPFSLYNLLKDKLAHVKDRFFPVGVWIDWDHITAKGVFELINIGEPSK